MLACDEHVIAVTCTFKGTAADGGGPTEIAFGWVELIEDGVCTRIEQFAHGDRVAMLARYAELSGGLGALGDSPVERVAAAYAVAYARRDIESIRSVFAEDWRMTDHRSIGWEAFRDRDEMVAQHEGVWASVRDIRIETDEILALDENTIANTATFRGPAKTEGGGGPFELSIAHVARVQDGRYVESHSFDPDDREALMACFAQLAGAATHRLIADYESRFNAHDLDGIVALIAEDCVQVDHRKIGWETSRGAETIGALHKTTFAGSADVRFEVREVLAADERVIAVTAEFRGTSRHGGGAFEIPYGSWRGRGRSLGQQRPLRARRPAAMIARYAELGGGLAALGDSPPERFWRQYAQRYAARDRNGVLAMHADGPFVDHRKLGWESTPTVDEVMAIIDGAWAATSDIRIEVDEVLASDERACALRIAWRGTAEHGVTWEIPMGVVTVVEGGRSKH